MSSSYIGNSDAAEPKEQPLREKGSMARSSRTEVVAGAPTLQFVTTTSTVAIDESSKRAIRKHASRYAYRAKPEPGAGTSTATKKPPSITTGGQIHRFRLGPQGLKHTPNQPPQVSKNFTILSLRSEEPAALLARSQSQPSSSISSFTQVLRGSGYGGDEAGEKEEEEVVPTSANKVDLGGHRDFSGREDAIQLARWAREQQQTWLEPLLFASGTSLFGPSSGSMDPFNAMALTITPREQILLRYYFTDRRQVSAPLIPYCQVWFGLAVQDKAFFHAVLSHYSATHRLQFQHESAVESINHLMRAIHMITDRLQDPIESCSNGTIGAVACLIIYESANGAITGIESHMRGLKEMVRRRGGLERADFPMDLKRLVAWTDLNTANDLWQPPRFPALHLPVSIEHSPRNFLELDNFTTTLTHPSFPQLEYALSHQPAFDPSAGNFPLQDDFNLASPYSSLPPPPPPPPYSLTSPPLNTNTVLAALKFLSLDITNTTKRLNALNRPHISTSDKIHSLERHIFDLIHNPPSSQSALDHACSIASLIFMRSNVRDSVCNFRVVDVSKLRSALIQLGDLGTLGIADMREKERLVWTVGFGAVASAGRPEREWFVRMFRGVCENMGLGRWEYVRAVFETVVWKEELDTEGMALWEEMWRV